jgi:hypothetical protein
MPHSVTARRPRSWFRRAERWLVGLVMGVLAFGLEKAVARNIRRAGGAGPGGRGTVVRSRGDDIDMDPDDA